MTIYHSLVFLGLDCPLDDHAYSPAEQIKCCTYSETDCTKSFSGSWQNFLKCNGQKTCSGVPVVRDEPICPDGDFPRFSNYLTLEYYCMPGAYFIMRLAKSGV